MTKTAAMDAASVIAHRNEVQLVGRLSAPAELRQLPSGDELASWRLVVQRPALAGRGGVDVIDCASFAARIRRAATGWEPGELLEVAGSLRRRFWRAGAGTASRYEVEVSRATRLR